MNAKHTSGPWTSFYKHKYDEWHVALPVEGSSMKLALCPDGIQSSNREADARLIAAAPELASSGRDLIVSLDPGTLNPEQFNAWSALSAALSKAQVQS